MANDKKKDIHTKGNELRNNTIIARGSSNQFDPNAPEMNLGCGFFAITAAEIILKTLLAGESIDNSLCTTILTAGRQKLRGIVGFDSPQGNPKRLTKKEERNLLKQAVTLKELTEFYKQEGDYVTPLATHSFPLITTKRGHQYNDERIPQTYRHLLENTYKRQKEDPKANTLATTFANFLNRQSEQSFYFDAVEYKVSLNAAPLAFLICRGGHWVCAVNIPPSENLYLYDSASNTIKFFDNFQALVNDLDNKYSTEISIETFTLVDYVKNPHSYPLTKRSNPVKIEPPLKSSLAKKETIAVLAKKHRDNLPKGFWKNEYAYQYAHSGAEYILERLINHQGLNNDDIMFYLVKMQQVINKESSSLNQAITSLVKIKTDSTANSKNLHQLLPELLNDSQNHRILVDNQEVDVCLTKLPLTIMIHDGEYWKCVFTMPHSMDETVYLYDSKKNSIAQYPSFDNLLQTDLKSKQGQEITLEVYTSKNCLAKDAEVYSERAEIVIKSKPLPSKLRSKSKFKPKTNLSFSKPTASATPLSNTSNTKTKENNPPINSRFTYPTAKFNATISSAQIPYSPKVKIENRDQTSSLNNDPKLAKNLELIRTAILPLDKLIEDLRKEFQEEKYIASRNALQTKKNILSNLKSEITNEINNLSDYDKSSIESLSNSLNKLIKNTLNKEEIKHSSTAENPVVKRIAPTLRGIASLLACITILPLISSRVRDHLFANRAEYTLNRLDRACNELKNNNFPGNSK